MSNTTSYVSPYTTENIGDIIKEDDNCFFKRISDSETLCVKNMTTDNPEVYRITRIVEFQSGVLMSAGSATRYQHTPLSGNEKQQFIDELNAYINGPRP